MRLLPLLIACISLAALAAVVAWEWTRGTSPGPIHPSHAAIASLRGGSNCAACHGQGTATMTDACLVCHTEIKTQLSVRTGIHGHLPQPVAACATCHSEHNAGKIPLVSQRTFAAVNVPDPTKFDHAQFVTFTLSGKHDSLVCTKCHPAANTPALGEHTPRFLGLTQDCRSCHKDPHQGTFGPDCASCHGQTQDFKKADGFVHTRDFPLTGGHAGLECKQCHESSGTTSVASLKLHPLAPRDCATCHASPHAPTLIAAVSRSAGVAPGSACVVCHSVNDHTFLHPVAKMTADQHAMTGFALTPTHAKVDCVQCHKEIGTRAALAKGDDLQARFAKLFPAHAQTACGDCHESPHKNDLVSAVAAVTHVPAPQSCSVCHGTTNLTFQSPPATMTPAQHAATGFNLDAPHQNVTCQQCHKDLGKAMERGPGLAARFAERFPGRTQSACEDCHADPHGGQFKSSPTAGRCADCHAPTHFVPSNFDVAAHAHTNMPLTGSHRAVACVACHPKVGDLQRFAGTPISCASCHHDVHAGRFAQSTSQPVRGNVGTDCARCHNTTAFAEVNWTPADHLKWAHYPLNGAHATTSCESCHTPLAKPGGDGRSFGRAATSCVACHVDVHAGQFAVGGFVDCARCHSDAGKFTQTTFDHQRDSRFKLDANHENVACDACHRPVAVGPVNIVRYKPLGTSCRDCHGPNVVAGGVAP